MSANATAFRLLSEVDATVLSFRRNVVVAASAGTGKTHRLTALYVLLTLGLTSMGQRSNEEAAPPVLPDRIWATTFTKAAAGEIAERVEHALSILARDPTSPKAPFAAEIAARRDQLRDGPTAAELKRRAAEALARWPAARIDTLHGMAGRILDRHGLTLGLPPGMRILDQEEAGSLTASAVDEVLSLALATGGEAALAARALLAAVGGIGPLRSQLSAFFDRLDEEGVSPQSLVLADHTFGARDLLLQIARVAAAAAAPEGSATFRPAAAQLSAALSAVLGPSFMATSALAAPPANANAGSGAAAHITLPDAAVAPLLELLTKRMPSKKRPADEEVDAFRKSLGSGTLRQAAERLIAFLTHAPDLCERETHIVRLLTDARTLAQTKRLRAGGLAFSDLLRATRDGLRDLPDLAERVRADVDVLLVDEFQDTSTVQRDLVYLLRERADARARRLPGSVPVALDLEAFGLFLVGDRKQSIYGFRGADVAVFSRICAELGGAAAAHALRLSTSALPAAPNADFVALSESRRSGASILQFVNTFSQCDFAEGRSSADPRDFEVEYSPAEHLLAVRPPEERGAVVLVEDDGAVPEGADALTREAFGPLREALVAAAWIASDQRQTGRPPSAYAVLARRRNSLPLVSVALERLGVPFVVAGRALYDTPEVRDLAALVRLMLDPFDRLALATVLRGPVVALSDTALVLLADPGRGLHPVATLDLPKSAAQISPEETRRLATFRATFAAMRRAALRAPPAAALRAMLSAFDLDRVLAALPRAEARLANVDRLIAIAEERGGSLAAFGRWLDRRIADETDEPEGVVFADDDDAVRLLTIHGSKGLSFKVVVLVDLAAEPRPSYAGVDLVPPLADRPASLLLRHVAPIGRVSPDEPVPMIVLQTPAMRAAQAESRAREQAERRRLTYVALTRAEDGITLVTPATPARGSSAWRSLSVALPVEARQQTVTRTENAKALLEQAEPIAQAPPKARRLAERAPKAAAQNHLAKGAARAHTIALPTTALSLFEGCARRYRLRYLLGFDEPLATTQLELFALDEMEDVPAVDIQRDLDEDARDIGRAAHRVLERFPLARFGARPAAADIEARLRAEGVPAESPDIASLTSAISTWLDAPYVREARSNDATILREEPFVLDVPSDVNLSLRGAMDLVVLHSRGSSDVIDYKRSRPRTDLSAYAFQLRTYALALHRRTNGKPVRAGVLFLGENEPLWLQTGGETANFGLEEHERFEEKLVHLTRTFAESRATDTWEGVAIERCRARGCGFVTACHRSRTKGKG